MANLASIFQSHFFALLLLSVPINIILHEFGHAIPAALLTKKPVQIFIGSLGDNTKSFKISFWRFTVWLKHSPFQWVRGLCRPQAKGLSIAAQATYIVWGPVAPFLVSIVLYLSVYFLNAKGIINTFSTVFFQFSGIMLIISLLPLDKKMIGLNGRGTYNDGYLLRRLYSLRRYNKEYNEALAQFDKKEYGKAGELLSFIISKNIHYEDIYRNAFQSYLMAKEFEKATVIWKYFESNFTPTSDDYCNASFLKLTQKQYAEAWVVLEKSIKLNPDNPHTLNNIGDYFISMKEYARAIPYLDKAIAINPKSPLAYSNRGLAKMKTERAVEGLADINKAKELDGSNPCVYKNLGIYHLDKGEYEEALTFFSNAAALEPDIDLDELITETKRQMSSAVIKA